MQSERMSISHMVLTIRNGRSVKGTPLLLLIMLATRANSQKGYLAWPSYRQLKADTGMDTRTLQHAVKKLVTAGLITVEQKANKSNRYYLNWKRIEADAAERKEAPSEPDKTKSDDHEYDKNDFIQGRPVS